MAACPKLAYFHTNRNMPSHSKLSNNFAFFLILVMLALEKYHMQTEYTLIRLLQKKQCNQDLDKNVFASPVYRGLL